jgi:8-oxo-dGTP pyrophosphatase MutT (NUDIX family)
MRIKKLNHKYHKKIPDILYHATTKTFVAQYKKTGILTLPRQNKIYLSANESQAWQVAHRLSKHDPEVLIVDANQASYNGIYLQKNRNSLYTCSEIPLQFILNLQKSFDKQVSSGSIPFYYDENIGLRLASILMKREVFSSWEIPKGKIEPGEHPEDTAERELREEVGYTGEVKCIDYLGEMRFGFLTPQKKSRLKIQHVYLLQLMEYGDVFTPLLSEGIQQVKWFSLDELLENAGHYSLMPKIYKAKKIFQDLGYYK